MRPESFSHENYTYYGFKQKRIFGFLLWFILLILLRILLSFNISAQVPDIIFILSRLLKWPFGLKFVHACRKTLLQTCRSQRNECIRARNFQYTDKQPLGRKFKEEDAGQRKSIQINSRHHFHRRSAAIGLKFPRVPSPLPLSLTPLHLHQPPKL